MPRGQPQVSGDYTRHALPAPRIKKKSATVAVRGGTERTTPSSTRCGRHIIDHPRASAAARAAAAAPDAIGSGEDEAPPLLFMRGD